GQVVQNLEAIKKQEKLAAGKDLASIGVLDGVPLASPALILAQEYQKRAASVGFEFSHLQEVLDKIHEELQEIHEASTPEAQKEEIGDLLFIVAKLARMLKIDAEEALRAANRKFKLRFQRMEGMIRAQQREFASYRLGEWMKLWERAKIEN
ncbi:MAG: MazG nucleotide pyrophosphohydrolase domain-containing protein, partial [Ktedonobacteraceae bacterium]